MTVDRKRVKLDIHCAGRECPDCVLKKFSTEHGCDFLSSAMTEEELDNALRIIEEDER